MVLTGKPLLLPMENQDVTVLKKRLYEPSPDCTDCTSTCPESHLAGQAALMSPMKAGKTVPNMQLLLIVNWGNLCCHTPAGAQLLGQTSTLSLSALRAPKNTKLSQSACSSSVLNQVGCWPFISPAGSQQASHGKLPPQQVPACVVPVLGWAVVGRGKWLKLCTKGKQRWVPLHAISGKPSILPYSCRLKMITFICCFHHNTLPMVNKTLVQWGHATVWSVPVLPSYRQQ